MGKKEDCDAGTIESPKATVVTYVEQDPEFPEGCTVRDAVYGADNPLMRYVVFGPPFFCKVSCGN